MIASNLGVVKNSHYTFAITYTAPYAFAPHGVWQLFIDDGSVIFRFGVELKGGSLAIIDHHCLAIA